MKTILILAATVALSACASAGKEFRARQDAALEQYQRFAGAPVDQVRTLTGIDRWQSLSPSHLVIWTSVNRAYLFTLRAPCQGLEFQNSILITESNRVIDRRFDRVRFEHQSCYIEEIRPVDYKALKIARRESRDEG
jgi:hypothetical protein